MQGIASVGAGLVFGDFGVKLNNLFCSTPCLRYPKGLTRFDIPNFSIVDPYLIRGGQPTEYGSEWLAKEYPGVDEIDLRSEREPILGGRGGIWVKIDNFKEPSFVQADSFLTFMSIIRSSGKIAFIHCQDGLGRTGTMVAIYRMNRYGWSLNQALKEARSFRILGLFDPLTEDQVDFLKQYESRIIHGGE